MRTVAAKTIKPKKLVLGEDSQREAKQERAKPIQEFKTLAEKVAKSSVFQRNIYIPELRERFKFADRMKRVDLLFPYARLGDSEKTVALYVDTPETEQDVEICMGKKKLMTELGYTHYCVIEKDSTVFDVLQQLGAI